MNKAEVLERVGPLVEGEVRNIRESDGARVVAGADVVSLRPRRHTRAIEMSPEGVRNMVSFAGLPLKIARELSHNTFSQLLSELMTNTGKYSIIVKDDRIVNVIPYGAQTMVNPERLLNTIEKIIPVRDYHRLTILDKSPVVSLEIVGQKTQPVVRGDLVRAGVKVDFSPMGIIRPVVQSYAVVLNCTNGATSNVVLNEFRGGHGRGGGEGDDIWQWFRASVKRAYGSFDQVVGQWKKLQSENIPPADRARMLAALLQKANITGQIADAVMAMAVENPPRNAWDMHNLITYASSHLLTVPNQVERTQRAAASFADETTHSKTCPLCHRTS
jgi:hypothetical protein